MMLGKTSLKMVSQEVVQTEFSVVHGLTRMHGLTRNEDILQFYSMPVILFYSCIYLPLPVTGRTEESRLLHFYHVVRVDTEATSFP